MRFILLPKNLIAFITGIFRGNEWNGIRHQRLATGYRESCYQVWDWNFKRICIGCIHLLLQGVSIADTVVRKTKEIKETHLLNIKERAGKATNKLVLETTIFKLHPWLYILCSQLWWHYFKFRRLYDKNKRIHHFTFTLCLLWHKWKKNTKYIVRGGNFNGITKFPVPYGTILEDTCHFLLIFLWNVKTNGNGRLKAMDVS